jgi:hypothetical protein
MFCRSLFVIFYFFLLVIVLLFFFDIRILITPLVSQIMTKCLLQTEKPTICTKTSERVRVMREMKVIITTYFYIYREHLARIIFSSSTCRKLKTYIAWAIFSQTNIKLLTSPYWKLLYWGIQGEGQKVRWVCSKG